MASATTVSAAPLLEVEGLECRRGERSLFKGLRFSLAPGRIVWIRGANGRGKTTLLRTLAGLSRAEAGSVRWREPPPRRALYLAHGNGLKDDLGAAEALAVLLRLDGAAAGEAEVAAALDRVGLASRRHAPVRTLSQGQRRRVALARLTQAGGASTWLLDEPYDALDSAGCALLDALLAGHAAGGGGIVLTSHLPLAIAEPVPESVSLDPAA